MMNYAEVVLMRGRKFIGLERVVNLTMEVSSKGVEVSSF